MGPGYRLNAPGPSRGIWAQFRKRSQRSQQPHAELQALLPFTKGTGAAFGTQVHAKQFPVNQVKAR